MNINLLNQRMVRKNLLLKAAVIIGIAILLILAFTMPAFAANGTLQTGKNVGEWGLDQVWYIALLIVAVMVIKFLAKKAWVPMAIFIVLGALCLFIISSPDALKNVGQSIYNLFFK